MNLLDRLDLNLLRVLLAIDAQGGVSAAAQTLHLSQPAVSNALTRARETLGDPLFVREGLRLQPTPYARSLMPAVRAAMQGLGDALSGQMSFDPSRSERSFRIAMTDAGTMVFSPVLAQALRTQGQGLKLQIKPMELGMSLTKALAESVVDMVIGPLESEDTHSLTVTTLRKVRYVGVVSRKGQFATSAHRSDQITLSSAQLKALPMVMVEQHSTHHRRIPELLQSRGLDRQIVCRIPHFNAIGPLLDAYDGFAIVPDGIGDTLVQTRQALLCQLPFKMPAYTLSLAVHPLSARDAGLGWLASVAQSTLA